MNLTINPANGGKPKPNDMRGPALNTSVLDSAERLRLAGQFKTLAWGATTESLIALFEGSDDALVVAVAKLESLQASPPKTPVETAPAPATNQHEKYSINEVMYQSDPQLAHLDSIARRMVCELHQNYVFPALNDTAILDAYNELIVANAQQGVAVAHANLAAMQARNLSRQRGF